MTSNKRTIIYVITTLVLTTIACTTFSNFGIGEAPAEATSTLPVFATSTPISVGSTSTPIPGDSFTLAMTPTQITPTVQAESTEVVEQLTATITVDDSKSTGARCLFGTWGLDNQSVINYLTLTMLGTENFGFTPDAVQGTIQLDITAEQINLDAQDFDVSFNVNVGDVAGAGDFGVTIQADGTGSYLAQDTSISVFDITYDASGVMTTGERSFQMGLADLHNIGKDLGFAVESPTLVTQKDFDFTCAGNVMTVVVNHYAVVLFSRVNAE
ncbi:MAG: hypothetical protein N2D54_03370 [Chloroflexota bacterium]